MLGISVIIGVAIDIGVGVLVNVNTNFLAGVMTALEFATSEPLKEFSCWAAFDCLPLALLKDARVLHA